MSQQVPWFERHFTFGQQNIFPSIIERLTGTPARLEEKLAAVSEEALTYKKEGAWSIKEQVGHLSDLEPLWQGRLEDILTGQTELRPADLQNRTTHEAGHNHKNITELLQHFRNLRRQTIHQLKALNEAQIFQSALHPRLKTPMRTMDLFLFVAEHDDHHLADITFLLKSAIS